MLERGRAYRCYSPPAEIEAAREAAKAESRAQIIRKSVARPRPQGRAGGRQAGDPPQVAARGRDASSTDHVQGARDLPQQGSRRPHHSALDGNPTYNLAVVVDDHDMGVTHVVRGVDHLTNAARQTQIYEAMDWAVPEFAHVPLIHGPDGSKLSKRHGALGVEAYRAMGYLPAALRNYLVRLGWGHGNDEIISTPQLVEWFGLDGIGKSPARFDYAKLTDLNGHYIRTTPDAELVRRIEDILPEIEGGAAMAANLAAGGREKLTMAMPGLKERAKTLLELVEGAQYLFASRPLQLDDKAKALLDAGGARDHRQAGTPPRGCRRMDRCGTRGRCARLRRGRQR